MKSLSPSISCLFLGCVYGCGNLSIMHILSSLHQLPPLPCFCHVPYIFVTSNPQTPIIRNLRCAVLAVAMWPRASLLKPRTSDPGHLLHHLCGFLDFPSPSSWGPGGIMLPYPMSSLLIHIALVKYHLVASWKTA